MIFVHGQMTIKMLWIMLADLSDWKLQTCTSIMLMHYFNNEVPCFNSVKTLQFIQKMYEQ